MIIWYTVYIQILPIVPTVFKNSWGMIGIKETAYI